MKVICSVNLFPGEIDAEECLRCAKSHDRPMCGYDYSLLRAIYGSNESEARANEIHVTDLTGCLKKAYLDKREPTAERPHEMLVRWLGTGIHSQFEEDDPLYDSELPISAYGITGRSDIVYKNGRLVDIKTTRWMMTEKLPYGSHILQVNIYAWMLRKNGVNIDQLQIQYIDLSGPTKCRKCSVPVRMHGDELQCPICGAAPKGAHLGAYLIDVPIMAEEELKAVMERKETLRKALDSSTAPQPEPGYLCAYCAHYEKCQPEIS